MRASVKLKLGVSFAVVIALSAAATMLGINSLATLNESMERVIQGDAERLRQSQEINADVLAAVAAEKNLILADTQEQLDRYEAEMLKSRAEVKKHFDLYRGIATAWGRQKAEAFDAAWSRYVAVQDKIRELARVQSLKQARHLSREDGQQAFNRMVEPLQALIDAGIAAATAEELQVATRTARLMQTLTEVRGIEKDLILTTSFEASERFRKAIETKMAEAQRQRDALTELAKTPPRLSALAAYSERFESWRRIHLNTVALGHEKSDIKAQELSTTVGRPQLEQALVVLEEILHQNAESMKKADEEADVQYGNARTLLLAALAGSVLIAIVAATWIALSISRGLRSAVALADAVALGDLDQQVSVSSNDEIKDLVDALNRMTANLRVTAEVANQIAAGNLMVQAKPVSDRDTLGIALKTMLDSLRSIVADAAAAAQNVSAGSQELSASAEQLSQGATEQAAAAEEASSSMEEMASNVKQNAENAGQTEK
ncbi:MCP four helix bundle domain-containing protein, partial [Azospirillum sp. TSO22-1]|uniref:MCP four helix bundle domain-containing protein n=1 Tax=Azospirillum sp. TSO22-1 TaxID=716789 RepID=UPI000D613B2D